MNDSRFVRVYYWRRIYRALRTGKYARSRCAREKESRGDETRESTPGDAETSIDSPASTIFRRRILRRELHPRHFVCTTVTVRTTRNFLYGNQLSFDRCSRARARLCTCVNVVRRALPIARPDSSRDAVNMLIYWRRVRFEYTQVAKGYVWFLRDSFRRMTGIFVDISVKCCRRAEYWFLPPVKSGRITSPNMRVWN